MMKQTIFCVFWASVSYSVKSVDFSFQNVTAEWFLSSGKSIVTPGKLTNSLKEMHPEDESDTDAIAIKGKINTLYENSVKDIVDLREIDVSSVGLRKIEAGAFKNVPNLKNIYLGNNSLAEIKKGTFVNLEHCHSLNLSNNQISSLEPRAFQNLINLSYLHLSKNKISKIQRGVFDNITIRIMDFSDNLIDKIEDGFLEKVICFNGLNGYLVLSKNRLEEINPNAFIHSEVTHLYLDSNIISQLRPGDFKNLPNLQLLDLRGNKLREIRDGIFSYSRIITLDLSHNEISEVASEAFDNMRKLRVIYMNHNKIKTWNNNWFPDSAALVAVFASHNLIEEIPEKAFKNYHNTFCVDLQSNHIKKINTLAFYHDLDNPTKLKYLILRNNEIQNWNKYWLVNLANVTIYGIDLRGNKLTCFEGDIYEIFQRVAVVWLSKNPFHADCAQRIKDYILQHQNYKEPELLQNVVKYI